MNKRGIFGLVIILVLAVMLVWIWAILMPVAIAPSIDIALNDTASAAHADGIGFFVRMIPWLVPFIFVIGLFWLGVTK
jgi:hypothetical protein